MSTFRLGSHAPYIPTSAWIARSAMVIGNVRLEREASVWFGAVLRGDIEPIHIGEGSNIQDNAILHTDVGYPLTVGRFCTIGHRAVLHGCAIGENSLVGIGATVLSGATVGANCIVGAHALVTEGRAIPDNSLVIGSPAKVVRELSAEEITGIAHNAKHYIENFKRFSAELVGLD